MKRRIISFDKDDSDDWRAELECGHYQHVRHNPPLIIREWVLNEEGRKERLGAELECRKCGPAEFEHHEHSHPDDYFPEGMNATDLIDHIIEKHHVFTRQELVRLSRLMNDVNCSLGETHPEAYDLKQLFGILYNDLFTHLKKEETDVFPYIKELDEANTSGRMLEVADFGSVRNPIRILRLEHEETKNVLNRIRKVTDDHKRTNAAGPTFQALCHGIEELEKDLQQHIHLENNILFPLAGVIETRVLSSIS